MKSCVISGFDRVAGVGVAAPNTRIGGKVMVANLPVTGASGAGKPAAQAQRQSEKIRLRALRNCQGRLYLMNGVFLPIRS